MSFIILFIFAVNMFNIFTNKYSMGMTIVVAVGTLLYTALVVFISCKLRIPIRGVLKVKLSKVIISIIELVILILLLNPYVNKSEYAENYVYDAVEGYVDKDVATFLQVNSYIVPNSLIDSASLMKELSYYLSGLEENCDKSKVEKDVKVYTERGELLISEMNRLHYLLIGLVIYLAVKRVLFEIHYYRSRRRNICLVKM